MKVEGSKGVSHYHSVGVKAARLEAASAGRQYFTSRAWLSPLLCASFQVRERIARAPVAKREIARAFKLNVVTAVCVVSVHASFQDQTHHVLI